MESRISELESRLLQLESSTEKEAKIGGVSEEELSNIMRDYQLNILNRLKEIRSAMKDGDVATVTQERDEAREEVVKMKKEIEKLNYRIFHLSKHVQ